MSIENNSGTEHCGVRLPGGIRLTTFDGPQLCSPQPRGRADRRRTMSEEVSDECGQPIALPCVPQVMLYPTCYTDPNAPPQYQDVVLDGYLQLTIGAGCGVSAVVILNLQFTPVVGAIQVPCPRSGLPGFPPPLPPT